MTSPVITISGKTYYFRGQLKLAMDWR